MATDATPASGQIVSIDVAGLLRPDFWRYSLRFTSEGTPVLYQDGRRLTCSWKVLLQLEQGPDPVGANGNTAEG